MAFNPKQEYLIVESKIQLRDFHEYKEDFITRPPYQRKSVWPVWKQKSLLDSLFRRFYVPRLVIREVRLDDSRTVKEIIDGQQRITAIQEFFDNKYSLPESLKDIHPDLPYKYFKELSTDLRKFIDKELQISADIVKNIEDPKNPEHQKVATEIFWRLQQGESLNFMEVAHAKLSSLSRNFIVKYSDDITFDFDKYEPIDNNPNKHNFFNIINRENDRMHHLTLMARFLIIEEQQGYTDLRDVMVTKFIDDFVEPSGIGDYSFEQRNSARQCIQTLNLFYDVFKDDPMLDMNNGIKELSKEYLIISFYMLIRHLKKYYVISDREKKAISTFFFEFYQRWSSADNSDIDILMFSNNRQQSANNLRERDIILRQLFFEFLTTNKLEFTLKDSKRIFNESERIRIYRKDKGLCKICLNEGKSEKESQVSWSDYEADHIFPHAKGGKTVIDNGQVLCSYHNTKKGASVLN